MAAQSTAAELYAAFSGNAEADVTLRLLRSRSAIVYLAIMAARLSGGQTDGDLLAEQVDRDLLDLGSHWTERGFEVPSASELLDRWVREGFVARTLDAARNVERYQLTRGATSALAQIQSVAQDRSVATETVMEMVVGRLRNIAVAINPDPGEHMRDIDAKLAELTQRRQQIASGTVPQFDGDKVLDDIRMVTSLAERMPADIIGYGEKMRENSRLLLSQGIDADGGHAQALNDMFSRHDDIAESSEGKAFDAFYALIADHRLRESLERHVAEIVRGIPDLPDDLASALNGFMDRMWNEVQRVDEVRGQVYRRINTFVKDSDFLAYRALREQITGAQRAAAEAFEHVHAGRDLGIELPMGVVDSNSAGALVFHDGVIDLPEGVHATVGEMEIDPSKLVGAESIDWQALADAVNSAVEQGNAELEAVVAGLPAARTGDLIGLWSLAHRYGEVRDDRQIELIADTARGPRQITIPAAVFTDPIDIGVGTSTLEPVHLFDATDASTPTSGVAQ